MREPPAPERVEPRREDPVPGPAGDLEESWQRVIAEVMKKKALIGSVLQGATPLGVEAGVLMLALTGVPDTERGSSVGTVSTFFDLSQGLGAVILGGVVAVSSYRGAFIASAVLAGAGLLLLRSGVDPRTKQPTDPDAARLAMEYLEPDAP